tara:strand:+ start:389 stop:742 length:354 start_codon:yes stop_codon:yes gene_type:complete
MRKPVFIHRRIATTIQTTNGPKTVNARPTPAKGLVITGSRGCYTLTHGASGRALCRPSLANTNITLDGIRNAVFTAESVDLVTGATVDWTVSADKLAESESRIRDWLRTFFRTASMG